MKNVNDFFRILLSNFKNQSEDFKSEEIIVVKHIDQSCIDTYVYAIANFMLTNVRAEDRKIYAKQIVRECAFQYDSLMSYLLSLAPDNEGCLKTLKNGQKVIIQKSDQTKIDISNLLEDIQYFTQKISMNFDSAEIHLNEIYKDVATQYKLRFKAALDFNPFGQK